MISACRLITVLGVALLASLACATHAQQPASVQAIHDLIDSAEPGDVITVPPGVYEGNLLVRKAVTLDGRGVATIDAVNKGTVVEIRVPNVTFKGFAVRGSDQNITNESAGIRALTGPVVIENNTVTDTLFGIDIREAPDSVIRGNTIQCKALEPERRGDGIRLWWCHGAVVEHNTVSDSRDMVFWYSESLTIAHNTVSDSRYGLHFMYSHNTTLANNTLTANSVGIYLMYSNSIHLTGNQMVNNRGASGYGIGLKDCDDITIDHNALLANRVGIYLDNSPSSLGSTGLFEGNLIAFNEIGLLATPNTHDNVFTRNAFIENEQSAATHGRGQLTKNAFALESRGNYWSDYAGIDLDRDGIGDMPYEPRSLFGAMLNAEPNLRLFVHSPAQQAIEFTARALPELRPEPSLVDPSPLSQPPVFAPRASAEPRSALGMALVAGALLAFGLGGAALLGRQRLPEFNRKAHAS